MAYTFLSLLYLFPAIFCGEVFILYFYGNLYLSFEEAFLFNCTFWTSEFHLYVSICIYLLYLGLPNYLFSNLFNETHHLNSYFITLSIFLFQLPFFLGSSLNVDTVLLFRLHNLIFRQIFTILFDVPLFTTISIITKPMLSCRSLPWDGNLWKWTFLYVSIRTNLKSVAYPIRTSLKSH